MASMITGLFFGAMNILSVWIILWMTNMSFDRAALIVGLFQLGMIRWKQIER